MTKLRCTLLTFDNLPLPENLSTAAGLTPPAGTIQLWQHYRQGTGLQSIAGADFRIWNDLTRDRSVHLLATAADGSRAAEAASRTSDQKTDAIQTMHPSRWADRISEIAYQSELTWIHCCNDDCETSADDLVNAARPAADAQLLVVTSLKTQVVSMTQPFISPIAPNELRQTAWIEFPGCLPQQCQHVTVSDQLLIMIDDVLAGLCQQASDPSFPDCLMRGVTQNQKQPVVIRQADFQAVRDGEFLLVSRSQCGPFESSAEAPGSETESLFRLPEDRWCLHDVSREYPDVVDRLISVLDKAHD